MHDTAIERCRSVPIAAIISTTATAPRPTSQWQGGVRAHTAMTEFTFLIFYYGSIAPVLGSNAPVLGSMNALIVRCIASAPFFMKRRYLAAFSETVRILLFIGVAPMNK